MPDFRDWEKRASRPLFEDDEVDDLYDEDEDENGDKAPLPLRIVAWISVLVLLFAGGYWGTSLTLKYLDKKQIIGQHNVVRDPDEARRVAEDTSEPTGLAVRRSGFEVFVPRGDVLEREMVSLVPGILEDDVKTVISGLLETMRAENTISEQVRVLHVFRNGDLLYLDLNDPFVRALQNLPGEKGALIMTSLVRTIVQNFSPVTRVRILINGKDPELKTPVDLTMPWQLKTS
ncbi:MAG TPA: GerMN domain-containing protein [Synergistales bacterium]|nr:GerMN domain-containing protein [Synergistales bacterium]